MSPEVEGFFGKNNVVNMEKAINSKILLVSCSIRGMGSNTNIALDACQEGIADSEIKKVFLKDSPFPIDEISWANGIIFATPVYFGDSSSYLFELIRELNKRRISLRGKVVGFCAVGAKRNGGQETTIEWNAWDVMGLGACVVNDGAPISQFGGVVVAGKHGTAKDDKEGMDVCKYLGKRVEETVKILLGGNLNEKTIIRKWDMKKLSKGLDRCGACLDGSSCPLPINEDYKCRNKTDNMGKIHSWLMEANGIIPSRLNMRFVERTRYLRRDNYRLTYHVVKITHPRFIHIFIKENSILCRKYFEQYVSLIASGRKKLTLTKQIYEPIGYKK